MHNGYFRWVTSYFQSKIPRTLWITAYSNSVVSSISLTSIWKFEKLKLWVGGGSWASLALSVTPLQGGSRYDWKQFHLETHCIQVSDLKANRNDITQKLQVFNGKLVSKRQYSGFFSRSAVSSVYIFPPDIDLVKIHLLPLSCKKKDTGVPS